MTSRPRHSLSRRHFLRGVGGAVLALPHLNLMAAAEPVPMRMVCVGTTFGFVPKLFFPTTTGRDYTLPTLLKPLATHRQQFTVFSKLDHGINGVGGHQGVHAYLSGILSKNSKGFKQQNVSVDQKAAAHVGPQTRFPSLQITSGTDPNNLLSWSSAGVALPPLRDPQVLYNMLFQRSNSAQRARLKRIHRDESSILDLVRRDADALAKRVGREDKEKLDQYYTSVRSVERRLAQSAGWIDHPKPQVDYTLPRDAIRLDFVDRVPLYYDLMALALQTDSTRVITFEISDIGANSGGLPITKGYHQLTHHGKVPSYLDELLVIERFHSSQFARFLDQLAAIPEPNGKTLLDNSMALLGSGMGNASSHSNRDLPLLLAGGGFRHGQHLRFDRETPAANLFVSMLQRFGLETELFNLATGTLTGLDPA